MAGTDIVQCQFLFSGEKANDAFICSDRKANPSPDQYELPPVDAVKDVVDVGTMKTFNEATKKCDLAATFQRKLNTGDKNDYTMRDGDTFDAIWAWGYMYNGSP